MRFSNGLVTFVCFVVREVLSELFKADKENPSASKDTPFRLNSTS